MPSVADGGHNGRVVPLYANPRSRTNSSRRSSVGLGRVRMATLAWFVRSHCGSSDRSRARGAGDPSEEDGRACGHVEQPTSRFLSFFAASSLAGPVSLSRCSSLASSIGNRAAGSGGTSPADMMRGQHFFGAPIARMIRRGRDVRAPCGPRSHHAAITAVTGQQRIDEFLPSLQVAVAAISPLAARDYAEARRVRGAVIGGCVHPGRCGRPSSSTHRQGHHR